VNSHAEKLGGKLKAEHPLYAYLAADVLPRVGIETKHPHFSTTSLDNRQAVYLCREQTSHAVFVCKFFGRRRGLSEGERRSSLNHEFGSLLSVRNLGFCQFPHRVVRPVSKSEKIAYLLVEDFARGHDLDYYIAKAAYEGQHQRLLGKLTKLARFLVDLHNRTAGSIRVNFTDSREYFIYLVNSLVRREVVDLPTAERLTRLGYEWEQSADMRADVSVLVHGDATPTNFIFHHDDGMTAIDLERVHPADRMYDVGMIAAELKHHFAWRILQAGAAEPFIEHFLRVYCQGFPDPESAFRACTHRSQFYMALGELRIARNSWLPWKHRKWLVKEAICCLST